MNISIYGNAAEGYAVVEMVDGIPHHIDEYERIYPTERLARSAAEYHIAQQWIDNVAPYLHEMGNERAGAFIKQHRPNDAALCVAIWNWRERGT